MASYSVDCGVLEALKFFHLDPVYILLNPSMCLQLFKRSTLSCFRFQAEAYEFSKIFIRALRKREIEFTNSIFRPFLAFGLERRAADNEFKSEYAYRPYVNLVAVWKISMADQLRRQVV